MIISRVFLIPLIFFSVSVPAQQQQSGYDPHTLFSPSFYPAAINEYRAATGEPGVRYWQNKASYQIAVSLDDVHDAISGSVSITYINNSPHTLAFLWLQLDQNLFKPTSRGHAKLPATERSRNGDINDTFNGGYTINAVEILSAAGTGSVKVAPVVTDTRMQIILPTPLSPYGGTVKLKIDYGYLIPNYGSDRTGILPTENGNIYAIAQWYPRMCVFDDINGWNTLPYLGAGEFYLEYGDYDVAIEAPAGHIVVSSGELQNPADVLTPEQLKRYSQAIQSDNTVIIRPANEINKSSQPKKERLTWRFKINNARDVAWSSSKSFIWDAAKINLPSGKKAVAMSAYPVESKSANGWEKSTAYIKGIVENYSKRWLEYPYKTATSVATSINGMEYPAIIFCSSTESGNGLFDVTDHELGHTWFPMIVGSNERKYGWMDEGFSTFINSISKDDFNNGEFKEAALNMEPFYKYLFGPGAEAIMNTPDVIRERNIGNTLYFKPAYALGLLRNEIIGPGRFDYAFKTYIERWAYKHPTPWDFFRTIENVSGEDLGWFWKGVFIESYTLDQAVTQVGYINNDFAQGGLITIENLGQMAMPVELEYETMSGLKNTIKLPVEVWQSNVSWTVRVNTNEAIRSVTVDPRKVFPDVNFVNNRWLSR